MTMNGESAKNPTILLMFVGRRILGGNKEARVYYRLSEDDYLNGSIDTPVLFT